jgi:hypothetical protein
VVTTLRSPSPEDLPRRARRSALLLLAWLGVPLALTPGPAASSPWWENYEQRDTFRCGEAGTVVLERNDAQASLLSGRVRSTLFREKSDAPGMRYSSGPLRVILRGDELVLEQLPQRLTCLRTEST